MKFFTKSTRTCAAWVLGCIQFCIFMISLAGFMITEAIEIQVNNLENDTDDKPDFIGICLLMCATMVMSCSSYHVFVRSEPAFATIYENYQRVGDSKVHIKYKIPDEYIHHDSIQLPRYSLVWFSSATAETTLTIPKTQKRIKLTLRSDSIYRDSLIEHEIRAAMIEREIRRH